MSQFPVFFRTNFFLEGQNSLSDRRNFRDLCVRGWARGAEPDQVHHEEDQGRDPGGAEEQLGEADDGHRDQEPGQQPPSLLLQTQRE